MGAFCKVLFQNSLFWQVISVGGQDISYEGYTNVIEAFQAILSTYLVLFFTILASLIFFGKACLRIFSPH